MSRFARCVCLILVGWAGAGLAQAAPDGAEARTAPDSAVALPAPTPTASRVAPAISAAPPALRPEPEDTAVEPTDQTLPEAESEPSWQPDVWHHVQPDSPFYTDERSDMHSAGLVQSDGQFALLVLGTPEQGGLISVNLPGAEPASELTSGLELAAGNVMSRTVTADQLMAIPTPDGASHTYSFRIAPDDVRLFKAALRWTVKAGDQSLTLTLKGSKKAITRAIEARDSIDVTEAPDAN